MYMKRLWSSVWIGEVLEESKQAVYVKVLDDCDKNAISQQQFEAEQSGVLLDTLCVCFIARYVWI